MKQVQLRSSLQSALNIIIWSEDLNKLITEAEF